MIMITVAFLLGLIFCLLLGVPYIEFLRKNMFEQYIKDVAPEAHKAKAGTPTTGGVFIVISIIVAAIITLMLSQAMDTKAIIILITFLFYALAGFQDDFIKIKGKANKGLSARGKFLRQVGIALLPALFITFSNQTTIIIGAQWLHLGWLYPFLAVFIITGFSNAFNLTDGLDGLAASAGIPVFICIAAITEFTYSHSSAIIAAATAGALLGFLRYNKAKAQVFMGDTGSLALGGLMGTLAIVGKFEYLIIVMAGIFVLETLSVIIQVGYFKRTGKRVFKMAPLHHHFELEGWGEKKIVQYFTLLSILFSILAITVFKVKF